MMLTIFRSVPWFDQAIQVVLLGYTAPTSWKGALTTLKAGVTDEPMTTADDSVTNVVSVSGPIAVAGDLTSAEPIAYDVLKEHIGGLGGGDGGGEGGGGGGGGGSTHCVEAVEPAAEILPAGHATQDCLSVAAYVPAAHGTEMVNW